LEKIKKKLLELLDEFFKNEEYQDCYFVDMIISKSARVQVFVDCDSGVNLYKCGRISRFLEKYLDESLVLGEKYTLEVSSPGIGRPLIKRQYPKNIGRRIKIKTLDGQKLKGKLTDVTKEGIRILIDLSPKEQKPVDIAFNDIGEAKIVVSFNNN
jgi:ribosome maturation factor RimP